MDHPEPVVSTTALCREFTNGFRRRKTVALRDISISVPPGTIVGLLGPNGAGKTTLLSILVGLVRPSSGHAKVNGFPPTDIRSRDSLGYMPESFGGNSRAGARHLLDQINYFRNRCAQERDAEVTRSLGISGLSDASARPVRTYSKGMRQQLCFAQAILGDPALLLLDEPMSGLDPRNRQRVLNELRDRQLRGRTTVLSTHVIAEIADLVDYLIILNSGEVRCTGHIRELLCQDSQKRRVAFRPGPGTGHRACANAVGAKSMVPSTHFGDSWVIEVDATAYREVCATLITHGATVLATAPARTLIELYLEKTASEDRDP